MFKSKQRAKHGHLFGEDPLSAGSAVVNDPLSAVSSRSTSPSANGKSGSIFNDIDIDKLRKSSSSSSIQKRTVHTSLRSDEASDEDNERLFAGSSRTGSVSGARDESSTKSNDIKPAIPARPPRPPVIMEPKNSLSSDTKSPAVAKTPPPPPPRRRIPSSESTGSTQGVPSITSITTQDRNNLTKDHNAEQPRAHTNDVDPNAIQPMNDNDVDEMNPWNATMLPLAPSPQPEQQDHPVATNVDPARREAFADLIASWTNASTTHDTRPSSDDADHFYTRVAMEQQDVGFAGIADDGVPQTRRVKFQSWDLDDNPWSI